MFARKGSLLDNQFFFMPSQKNCPMKFGAAVNIEGMIIEVPLHWKGLCVVF